MCLSPAALAAFLTILGPEVVTMGETLVTVHADAGDTVWVATDDTWCTEAPRSGLQQALAK